MKSAERNRFRIFQIQFQAPDLLNKNAVFFITKTYCCLKISIGIISFKKTIINCLMLVDS